MALTLVGTPPPLHPLLCSEDLGQLQNLELLPSWGGGQGTLLCPHSPGCPSARRLQGALWVQAAQQLQKGLPRPSLPFPLWVPRGRGRMEEVSLG